LVRSGLKWEISKLLKAAGDEREFWLAYFNELVSGLTKDDVLGAYDLAIDMEQHYVFTQGDLANWTGSILILESDNDSVIKLSERAALRALYPQAEVHTFAGAGHAASMVKREEYIRVVKGFLSRVEKRETPPPPPAPLLATAD
jgi:pimeloyl-ACP methyl ester carboxylesterase